jgi:hypothetical protein
VGEKGERESGGGERQEKIVELRPHYVFITFSLFMIKIFVESFSYVQNSKRNSIEARERG